MQLKACIVSALSIAAILFAAPSPAQECPNNLLLNGGFEDSGQSWIQFPGTIYTFRQRTGLYSVYIGGDAGEATYTAAQSLTLPVARSASLSFYLFKEPPELSDDVEVKIDNTKILDLDAGSQPVNTWTLVTVDLSSFADGGAHTVEFRGKAVGQYFIDDACLTTCDTSIDFEGTTLPEFFGDAFAADDEYTAQGLQFSGQGALINGAGFGVTGLGGTNMLACNRTAFLAVGGTAEPPERITFRSPVDSVALRMATADVPGPGSTFSISLRAYNEADVEIASDVKNVDTTAMQYFTVGADDIKYVVMDTTADTLAMDDLCIVGEPLALSKCAEGASLSQPPRDNLAAETAPPVSAAAFNGRLFERFQADVVDLGKVRWWGTWINPDTAIACEPQTRDFSVTVYQNPPASTTPGTLISSQQATVTGVSTGRPIAQVFGEEYMFELALNTPIPNGPFWIGIQELGDNATCGFAWLSSETGDGLSYFESSEPGAESFSSISGDRAICFVPGLDFGDAPDPPYATLLAGDGARHYVDGVTYLGASVSAELDGQPNAEANGDTDDGVTIPATSFGPGDEITFSYTLSVDAYVNIWIDYNGDGDFADAGEDAWPDGILYDAGPHNAGIDIPLDAPIGSTTSGIMRFRVSSVSGAGPTGLAPGYGEVEDYRINLRPAGEGEGEVEGQGEGEGEGIAEGEGEGEGGSEGEGEGQASTHDFGDAPAPYATLLADNGPRHALDGTTYLGAGATAEADGQPTANADGDTDDGVIFSGTFANGETVVTTINATPGGFLSVWVDYNGDGAFTGSDENVFVGFELNTSPFVIPYKVPAGAIRATSGLVRFRYGTEVISSPTGLAPGFGEVEDYKIAFTVCSETPDNVVRNGGFENAAADWTFSTTFDLLNANPFEGLSALGVPLDEMRGLNQSLSQNVFLPTGAEASFAAQVRLSSPASTPGVAKVLVDNVPVLERTASFFSSTAYTRITADLSTFADGAVHQVGMEFVSTSPISYIIDAVEVTVVCENTNEGEGTVEGEGEGIAEGEGEGIAEGEGEGIAEGEGEGVVEGEGEGVAEGEGEGGDDATYEQLLSLFATADNSGDNTLTLAEIQSVLPGFTQQDLDDADYNSDNELSVGELLQRVGGGILSHADTSGDFVLQLTELLRLIQLFNAGLYACAENAGATEDGFSLSVTLNEPLCVLHSIDQNGDKRISLSELLRGIQLYNLGGYTWCPGSGSEDDFCG